MLFKGKIFFFLIVFVKRLQYIFDIYIYRFKIEKKYLKVVELKYLKINE